MPIAISLSSTPAMPYAWKPKGSMIAQINGEGLLFSTTKDAIIHDHVITHVIESGVYSGERFCYDALFPVSWAIAATMIARG